MRISFYGRLRDRFGPDVEVVLPQDGLPVAALRTLLAERHPALADDIAGRGVKACIDDTIVGEDHPVREGQRVEFFPPVSGG